MTLNKLVLEKDGLVVGNTQLIVSGNGISVGSLSVHTDTNLGNTVITGNATFTGVVTFSNTVNGIGGTTSTNITIPVGNTNARPAAPTTGFLRYNTDNNKLEYYANTAVPGWVTVDTIADGLSSATASPSGYALKQNFPSYTSGTYWILPTGQTTAIQMYVDMTADGGGYDFYPCTGCSATSYNTDGGSCPGGTRHFHGRSVDHWAIIWTRYPGYAATCGGVYKTGGGGNYTGCIMRNPASYGSGCSDWRVNDGGKWWLRNSTYSEPNGDYNANGWLNCGGSAGSDIGLNDGGAASTGGNYICSTNAKP